MYRLCLISVLTVLSGCATSDFSPSPGAGAYGAYRGEVRVLSRYPAAGTYEQLGIVIARGVRLTDKADLLEELKSEAARRGANAIILQGDVKIRRSTGGTEEKQLGAFAVRVKP